MKKFLFLVFFLFSIFYTFFTENIITSVSAQIVSSAFRDLNIELNKNIATEYFVGDGMLIEGKVLDKNKYALFFLKNIETEEKIMEVINVDVNGNFHIPISLPKKT